MTITGMPEGIDRRPPQMGLVAPPPLTRSTIPEFDLSAVTKLLVGGQWVKVKPGTLRSGAGAQLALLGQVAPVFVFVTPDGDPAIVRVDAVTGFAPVPDPRERI